MKKIETEKDFIKTFNADFSKEKIEILYKDENIAVIFKPSGMLSVPYPGSHGKTAIESLEQIMRKRGTFSHGHKPFAVHRLDRDTSGVMMFALNKNAQQKIMDGWQKIVTERLYRAVTENPSDGNFLATKGTIKDEIAYNAYNVGFVPNGKKLENKHGKNKNEVKTISAITHYKVIFAGKFYSLFELNLETGRKNQIRAHLAGKGYSLAGDENYRAQTNPFGRLALHARTLEFNNPFTGQHMKFKVPEPADWEETVKQSGDVLKNCVVNEKKDSRRKNEAADSRNTAKNAIHKERRKRSGISGSSDNGESGKRWAENKDIYAEVQKNHRPSGKKMAGMDYIQKGKLHK